jgi:hypothetical protein
MKSKIVFSSSWIFIVIIVCNVFLNNSNLMGNGSGAPSGKTNSPGDASNCTSCHNGTISTLTDLISSDIPSEGYTPLSTYTITASISRTSINKFGFQISPQNNNGNLLGTLINKGTQTKLVGSSKYITHTTSGTSATSNQKTWTFDWVAPAAGTGNVTFYGSFIAANSSNSDSGDLTFASTLIVSENTTVGINKVEEKNELQLFPNPIIENFSILNNLTTESIELISIDGKVIKEFEPNATNSYSIPASVENGMYLMKIKSNNKTTVERIIVAK